ncbi:MAG TPA: ATP-dependent helicase [Fervidicoccus fontis]|uniref:ATP-dependent helicase n=1 Tax=Fervidicoccus fontis TaxID=683846 RepID=A0A7C2UKZ7_9CREN|nr:ATP-dependent helicase [Fervidicoccus fontis]
MELKVFEKQEQNVLLLLRPYTRDWVKESFGNLTEPQIKAIPLIKSGENVLISSPTGTGKTLAAFLGIIDELYGLAEKGRLEEKIYAIYISPLRALNNDIRRNLKEPIEGIRKIAIEKYSIELPELKVSVRTSDTTESERQAMVRRPPHFLITTPESLSLILVSPRFRERLKDVKWVIVDEIHEMASSKRGTSLSLMLERLEWLVGKPLQRIGLSATIAPLAEIARFLGGYEDDGSPRKVKVIDARFKKPFDIKVILPIENLMRSTSEELNEAIYRTIADLVLKHRSTLIFTNTRSATERVVYKLKSILSSNSMISMDDIEAHHSSLSRNIRLEVEEKLKRGELKVVVSSTSLEMGIDIGYIDLVLLLSSPKSVSRLLQRVGRAGHRLSDISKGRIVVVDRDDLVECTVLAEAAKQRKIDKASIPMKPLDVLAQQIVAMSLESKWNVEDAYRLVKRSFPYHDLSEEEFEEVLRYLGGENKALEESNVYRKIWYDPVERTFGKKKGARMIFYLNQGTIPDEAKMKVYLKGKIYIGDLDEGFVQILSPGDIFVLGGRTFRFLRLSGSRVYVDSAEGLRPTVPSWFSEMLPLAFDSALLVGAFRRRVAELLENHGMRVEEVAQEIAKEMELDYGAAREIVQYVKEQYLFSGGIIASDRTIHIEIYDDERGRNLIFHSLFGRRTNDALSRAYALKLSEMIGAPVRVTVSDNAFVLTIAGKPELDVIKLVRSLSSREIEDVLKKALMNTELLKRRFRHCAQRALMILRNYKGWERSPHRMQLSAQTILEAVKNDPKNVVLRETFREIMEDLMDVKAARKVLSWIERGKVDVKITGPNDLPSPFAHHIIAIGYQDIVLMEDRKKLLMSLHERVIKKLRERGLL